jgi:hypothetical protein
MGSTRLATNIILCALLAACTTANPNAVLDGQGGLDGPSAADGGRPPGTIGGPCLPGDKCDPGLKCEQGRCVPAADGGQWDLPPILPDLPPTCSPVGFKKILVRSHTGGDWTVALEPQTNDKTLTLVGSSPNKAAAALDYDVAGYQVAGFVVSRPSANESPGGEGTAAVQALAKNIAGQITVRHGGRLTTTHDGFPAAVGVVLDLEVQVQSTISLVRKPLIASLLDVPVSGVGGAPPDFGTKSTTFVIRMAVVQRKDKRTVFVGAVTDRASDDDYQKGVAALSADLASANLLAQAGAAVDPRCDTQSVATPPKDKVDIIWVMDESGSMDSKRSGIAAGAQSFFAQLQQTGLDFRMGVTNVLNPNGTYSTLVGKFCSSTSTDPYSDGGVDRFLLPSEQSIFSACIKNPPGYEGGQEYGLVNSMDAVKRHLPRAASSVDKIRKDAQVVIIVVTDEQPQGLKNLFPGTSNPLSSCVLNAATQAKVDAHVKQYIDYLSGGSDPEAKIDYYQVIGGLCTSSTGATCTYKPEVAHGYEELAKALGGEVHDVCQADLKPTVTSIIGKIVAGAAPHTLQAVPIASSLQVALDSVALKRSLVSGFSHTAGTKEVLFTGSAKVKLGSTVVASYQIWN